MGVQVESVKQKMVNNLSVSLIQQQNTFRWQACYVVFELAKGTKTPYIDWVGIVMGKKN